MNNIFYIFFNIYGESTVYDIINIHMIFLNQGEDLMKSKTFMWTCIAVNWLIFYES